MFMGYLRLIAFNFDANAFERAFGIIFYVNENNKMRLCERSGLFVIDKDILRTETLAR